MNKYEKIILDMFEWTGSGCCCPELYDDSGKNCPSCEEFRYCGEGRDIVNENQKVGFYSD